jgi:thiaminase/transcriptional activator TenA
LSLKLGPEVAGEVWDRAMAEEMSFSEGMRARAQLTWDAVVDHRFFREVAKDTIDDGVFTRYLGIEYAFVDTAAVALGYAVAKAPSFRERRRLALGLHGLVTDQSQFFVSAFDRLGVPSAASAASHEALAAPLHDLFLRVAREEGYAENLACSLGAEWLYLTWCSKAAETPSSRPTIREWVALHAGGAFADQVDWTRSEIDRIGPTVPPERQEGLCALFEQTLSAEMAFHDAAYA